MNFDLYLSHGRTDPAATMDDWGFEGPRLRGVVGLHETYRQTTRIIFASPLAATHALALTGWARWDDDSLEMPFHDDLVRCDGDQPGVTHYFGDWGLIEPAGHQAAERRKAAALRAALAFVEGFEGDDAQDGVDGPCGLLAQLRAVCGGDPAMASRAAIAPGRAQPVGDAMPADMHAWLIDEMGARIVRTGGGCEAVRHDGPAGRYVFITGADGAGLPDWDNWLVVAYSGKDGCPGLETWCPLDPAPQAVPAPGCIPHLTLRQAVSAACELIAE